MTLGAEDLCPAQIKQGDTDI
ncbi:hypothetical protein VCR14J2_620053 [Vibrio coralliirubri]|nr:hypothetical protein VCR14J2_620053 [Vibrio coralliirubri]